MSTTSADAATRGRLSPRKRAQRHPLGPVRRPRAAVALLIAVAPNWRQIQQVFFRGDLIVDDPDPGPGHARSRTPSSTPRAPSSSAWCSARSWR